MDWYFKNLYFRKLELIVPVFFGCLISLILSVQIMVGVSEQTNSEQNNVEETQVALIEVIEVIEEEAIVVESIHSFARRALEYRDIIQELYREPATRERAILFFAEICASREIAEVILVNADTYDISPALALALAWEESRLNPRAVNSKNRDESVDRGLFQLNNRSFPRLEIQAFFNPELNARYGMSHLRHCLDVGGSEIAALAMYNAGTVRVRSSGTPKTTLDYISRILETRTKIENQFYVQENLFQDELEEIPEIIAEAKSERPRLVPLMPLAGK